MEQGTKGVYQHNTDMQRKLTFVTIKTFSILSSPIRQLGERSFKVFLENFVRCYEIYNGKDQLTIVALHNEYGASDFIAKLVGLGVSQTSLDDVLRVNRSDDLSKMGYAGQVTQSGDLSDHQAQAVLRIQHFWRKHWPKVRDARNFSQTFHGRTIDSQLELFTVCASTDLSIKEKIALRALFVTGGVDLQVILIETTDKVWSLRKAFSNLYDDGTLSWNQLEDLQKASTHFELLETDVGNISKHWSKENLRVQVRATPQGLSSIDLRMILEKDLTKLNSVGEQLDKLGVECKNLRTKPAEASPKAGRLYGLEHG